MKSFSHVKLLRPQPRKYLGYDILGCCADAHYVLCGAHHEENALRPTVMLQRNLGRSDPAKHELRVAG